MMHVTASFGKLRRPEKLDRSLPINLFAWKGPFNMIVRLHCLPQINSLDVFALPAKVLIHSQINYPRARRQLYVQKTRSFVAKG